MKTRRIVAIFPDPPLPFGTAAARSYYVLLKGLQERGHRVTAYATATPTEQEQLEAIFPTSVYDLRCFRHPERSGLRAKFETLISPYSYPYGPDLRNDLALTLTSGFDVLHIETLWTARPGVVHSAKALVTVHNLYSVDIPRCSETIAGRVIHRRVNASERSLLKTFPRFCALSDRLAEHVRIINPRAKVHVAPLGFDSSLYTFEGPRRTSHPTIGMIGSFNWYPTYSAGTRLLKSLWPKIRQRVVDARLLLVGRSAKSALCRHLPSDTSGITIEENVADTIPYFRKLDVMLYAPEVGTGMKVKVLEAFALGIAVVTNADGVEGLTTGDGRHAGVAETDEDLVNLAVALLKDPEARRRQASKARALVQSVCDPSDLICRFEDMYAQMAQ